MLLQDMLDHHLTAYFETVQDWEDAIRKSGETLKREGYIDDRYLDSIIECVKTFGPYIVLMKGIAMPHSTMGCEGVYQTGISFTKVEQPVCFDEQDSEKVANVFFTLAATNPEEHLANMVQLSELLMNEEVVTQLLQATCDEDLQKIIHNL